MGESKLELKGKQRPNEMYGVEMQTVDRQLNKARLIHMQVYSVDTHKGETLTSQRYQQSPQIPCC
jgi:hypothetical protein